MLVGELVKVGVGVELLLGVALGVVVSVGVIVGVVPLTGVFEVVGTTLGVPDSAGVEVAIIGSPTAPVTPSARALITPLDLVKRSTRLNITLAFG